MPLDKRLCELDKNGWRIPRMGTVARQIYRLMCEGLSSYEIAKIMKKEVNNVSVVAHKIRHPECYRRRKNPNELPNQTRSNVPGSDPAC